MLDGITVLSEQIVVEQHFWIWFAAFVILGFLSAITVGCCMIIKENEKVSNAIKSSIAIFLAFVFFGCVFGHWDDEDARSYTEYKVTIDSTVNFLDFEEKYIITGKEGQIYTIIDRNEFTDQS